MNQQNSIWAHCLQYAAKSDVGLRRANNQDSMTVAIAGSQEHFQQRGHLFMVADGMGAHVAGELASKIAVDTVPLIYDKLRNLPPPEALSRAIADANAQIYARGSSNPDFKGMGTTCSALALLPQGAVVAQVGDSRVYRRRGYRLDQLSFDHSLIWEMKQAGKLSPEAAETSVGKNIITRSLGPSATVKVDLEGPFPLEVGDTFLLCSDGLSGQVADDELGLVLSCLTPDEAVRTLIHLANLRGGPDNITVIVAQVTGPQVVQNAPPPAPVPAAAPARPPVSPLVWTWLGVSVLAMAAMAAMQQWIPAGVCGVSAAIAGLVALLRSGGEASRRGMDGRPLGKGPHVTCDCTPNAALVARIANLFLELRHAVSAENWKIDCAAVDAVYQRALAANSQGQLHQASCDLLRAILALMDLLKAQRG